ncbi:hypothetical protein PV327_007462 [Microctonus hyperodae]|uniref:Uncharacterized protein n=1 Tax=Microctonus hyperodae TaxID=165561 RepID=A0AA39KYM1_MICHY|nr:hypothetical protein PV327_007462 [Microctonus hyperodae]
MDNNTAILGTSCGEIILENLDKLKPDHNTTLPIIIQEPVNRAGRGCPDGERHFQRPEIIANPIYRILLKTGEGKSVIKFYLENGRLKKIVRNLLSRLVVNLEKDRQLQLVLQQPGVIILDQFKIQKELFISWLEDIEKLFPSESKFLHYSPNKCVREEIHNADGTIVVKKRRINPSGALYEHYGYLKSKLRRQHFWKRSDWQKWSLKYCNLQEGQDAAVWLATHLGPPDIVKQKWIKSYPTRMHRFRENITINQYIEEYPVIKGALGSDLLTWDFKNIYPDRKNLFFDRWETARYIIIEYLEDSKGFTGDDLGLYRALPALAQHNKDTILFYLLPYLLKSPRKSKTKKISIREKQEAFLIHANTAADINTRIERQQQICVATGSTL